MRSSSLRAETKTKLLFHKLFTTQASTKPNHTPQYFSLLHSSTDPTYLRHIHARLLRASLYENVVLTSKLVLMYSQLGRLARDSLSVFLHMPQRNIYSWNIVIGEFSRSKYPEKSTELFLKMWNENDQRPDDFTLPLVLRACGNTGDVNLGVLIHGLCVKLGFPTSLFVVSGLVFMYLKFGKVFSARVLFEEMPVRDPVLWTTMLSGYAQVGQPVLGLELFRKMIDVDVKLDWVVMVSLLIVCTQLGWLKHGKSVHGWCMRKCLVLDLNLGNVIVDMYVKCGCLSYAHKVFCQMSNRDVISWSSLILGYGMSGSVNIALDLFDEMRGRGVKPNNVTFLGVLSACAHGGLVEKGRLCFKTMCEHNVVPELKHYASMVDCFARAGLLEEAEKFLEQMPLEADAAVLGAVLGGCRVYSNVEVGERTAKKLMRLDPEKSGYYITLSNIYSSAGRHEEAVTVRELMKSKNVSKVPGFSSL